MVLNGNWKFTMIIMIIDVQGNVEWHIKFIKAM